MNANNFHPNDVLIDQTMLCEASRLFDQQNLDYLTKLMNDNNYDSGIYNLASGLNWWPMSNIERLMHLSTLLDAIALHERLFILPAELPPDAQTLKLRNILIEKGIVQEIDTVPYSSKISKEMSEFLYSLRGKSERLKYDNGHGKNSTIENITKSISELLEKKYEPEENNDFNDTKKTLYQGLSLEIEGTLSHWWLDKQRNRLLDNPLETLGIHILDKIAYFGSGAVLSGVSHLRTFVYWRLSEHANIMFYPSCRRLTQINLISDRLKSTIGYNIYNIIAKEFNTSLKSIYDDQARIPLLLPPFLAIFLEIYESNHDIITSVVKFRNEFSKLRSSFSEVEEKLSNAQTIKERKSLKREIIGLSNTLKSSYSVQDDSYLENTLSFVPDIVNPLTNPLDPSKYSKDLLIKPTRWIKNWWIRRPFRHVFQIKKRLESIRNYDKLVMNSFGIEVDNKEYNKLFEHYMEYMYLYGQDK